MSKTDAKKPPLTKSQERRKQAVQWYCKGFRIMEVVKLSGLCHRTVRTAITEHEQGGAIKKRPETRGRREGDGRALTEEQAQRVQQLIYNHQPEQLGIDFALWSWVAVMQLIERECGITLSPPSVKSYLKRWKFTPKETLLKAEKRCPEMTQQWLEYDYPRIIKRARSLNAQLHWGSETFIMRPTLAATNPPQPLRMIATFTNQHRVRWMMINEPLNADRFIVFLEALLKDIDRKLLLILNNTGIYRSNTVKDWAANRKDQIELFYLPC